MQTFRELRAKVSSSKLKASANLREDLNDQNQCKNKENGGVGLGLGGIDSFKHHSSSTHQPRNLNNFLSLPSNQQFTLKSKPSRIRRLSSNQLANAVSPFELDALGDESVSSVHSQESIVGFNASSNGVNDFKTPARTPEMTPDSSPLPMKNLKSVSINETNLVYPDSPSTTTTFRSNLTSDSSSTSHSSPAMSHTSFNDGKATPVLAPHLKNQTAQDLVLLQTSESDTLEYLNESQYSIEPFGRSKNFNWKVKSSLEKEEQEEQGEESGDLDGLEMELKESVERQGDSKPKNEDSVIPSFPSPTFAFMAGIQPGQRGENNGNDVNPGLGLILNGGQGELSAIPTRDHSLTSKSIEVEALKANEKQSLSASSSLSSLEGEIQDDFPSPPMRTPGSIKDLLIEYPFFKNKPAGTHMIGDKSGGEFSRGVASARHDTFSNQPFQTFGKSELLPAVTLNSPSRGLEVNGIASVKFGNMHLTSPLAKRRLERNLPIESKTILQKALPSPPCPPPVSCDLATSSPSSIGTKVNSPKVTFSPDPSPHRSSSQTQVFNARRTSRFFYVRDGEPVGSPNRPPPSTPNEDSSRFSACSIREPPMSAPLYSQPFPSSSPISRNQTSRTPEGRNRQNIDGVKKSRFNSGAAYDDWLWTPKASGVGRYSNQGNGVGGKGSPGYSVLGYTGRRPLQGQLQTLQLPSRYSSLSPSSSKPNKDRIGVEVDAINGSKISRVAVLNSTAVDPQAKEETWETDINTPHNSNALGFQLHPEPSFPENPQSKVSPLEEKIPEGVAEGSVKNLRLKALNLPAVVTRPRSNSRSAPPTPTGTRDHYFPSSSPSMKERDLISPPSLMALLEAVPSPASAPSERCVHPPEMVCLAGCCARAPSRLNSPSMSFRRIVSESDGTDPTDIQASSDALVHATDSGANTPSLKKKPSKPTLRRLTLTIKRSKSSPALRKMANAPTETNVPSANVESCDESFHCLEAGPGDLGPKDEEVGFSKSCASPSSSSKPKTIEVDSNSIKSKTGSSTLKRIRTLARVAGFRRSFKGGNGKEIDPAESKVPALTEAMRVVAAEKEKELMAQADSAKERIQTDPQSSSTPSRSPVLSMSFLERSPLPLGELPFKGIENVDHQISTEVSSRPQDTKLETPFSSTPSAHAAAGQTELHLPSSTSQFLSPTLIVSDSNSQMEIRCSTTTRSSSNSDPFRFSQFESANIAQEQDHDEAVELEQSSDSAAAIIRFPSDPNQKDDAVGTHHLQAGSTDTSESDYSADSLYSDFDSLIRSAEDDSERTRYDPETFPIKEEIDNSLVNQVEV